eukprot:2779480-Rhodomonas_salina.1
MQANAAALADTTLEVFRGNAADSPINRPARVVTFAGFNTIRCSRCCPPLGSLLRAQNRAFDGGPAVRIRDLWLPTLPAQHAGWGGRLGRRCILGRRRMTIIARQATTHLHGRSAM